VEWPVRRRRSPWQAQRCGWRILAAFRAWPNPWHNKTVGALPQTGVKACSMPRSSHACSGSGRLEQRPGEYRREAHEGAPGDVVGVVRLVSADELKPAGLDWITALRAPQIRALLDTGAFQLSLFDERDLAEITAPEFPGERLVVCKNPLLAEERARKREDLLQATEAALGKLADRIACGTGPQGQDKIARAVGRIENRYKLAKLFDIAVAADGFTFARNHARIAAEARLDGFYVIRTSVVDKTLAASDVVGGSRPRPASMLGRNVTTATWRTSSQCRTKSPRQ